MPYGIITNCAAVFLGGILGAVLKNYFPQKLKEALPNIFGLSAITMGISLIIMLKSLSAVVPVSYTHLSWLSQHVFYNIRLQMS